MILIEKKRRSEKLAILIKFRWTLYVEVNLARVGSAVGERPDHVGSDGKCQVVYLPPTKRGMAVDAVAECVVVSELAKINCGAAGIRELHPYKVAQRLTQICRLIHDLPRNAQRAMIMSGTEEQSYFGPACQVCGAHEKFGDSRKRRARFQRDGGGIDAASFEHKNGISLQLSKQRW